MTREIVRIDAYHFAHVHQDGVPMWGALVRYIDMSGRNNTKSFPGMDEVQAFAAFMAHCDYLDKKRKAKNVTTKKE